MIDWFNTLGASQALAAENASILQEQGFVVIPGPVVSASIDELSRAYDATEASATGDDIRIGSTTTRVRDFVNRGPEVDDLNVFAPLLDAEDEPHALRMPPIPMRRLRKIRVAAEGDPAEACLAAQRVRLVEPRRRAFR